MGNTKGKVIEIKNIQQFASQCQQLGTRNCKVYGQIHLVKYHGQQFYLKETRSNQISSELCLHYIIPSQFLVIPVYTLLEDALPSSLQDIIELMKGVGQLCCEGVVGIGHKRVGFAGKWGIVGEASPDSGYHQILRGKSSKGIYLSPQQIINLSQRKQFPKHNVQKSDVFSFAIMLIQLIFKEDMSCIYDYNNFEIKLKPLLSRLNIIKQQFGQPFYRLLLLMLEIEQQARITFSQVLLEIQGLLRSSQKVHTSHIRAATKSPIKRRPVTQRTQQITFLGGKIPQRIPINQRPYRSPQHQRPNMISPTKSPMKLRNNSIQPNNKQNTFNNFIPKSPFKIQTNLLPKRSGLTPLRRR